MKTVHFVPASTMGELKKISGWIRKARPGEIIFLTEGQYHAMQQVITLQVVDEPESDSDGGECD